MLRVHRAANDSRASAGRAGTATHPIEAATAAVAEALADAHERGDSGTVRILHAVLALLTATPRHDEH